MRANRPIYLDNHATTPPDPRVLAVMRPWWEENFANPHSVEHAMGREAEAAVETARGHVAALLGADPREIVLTSGATEANNLAIKGLARFARAEQKSRFAPAEQASRFGRAEQGPHFAGAEQESRFARATQEPRSARAAQEPAVAGGPESGRRRVVTLATEHKCILESVRDLAAEGFEPVVLPVMADGLVDLDVLRDAVDERTLLVSIMAVNNETGVIQDLAAIGAIAAAAGALFHTDAAQAAGRLSIDVGDIGAALVSLSGHKMYGPKGIGALHVRRRPRTRLLPLFSGGGQERGLRSGTLPTPLVVGLGEAARLAAAEGPLDAGRVSAQRDLLWARLQALVPGIRLNGHATRRVAGNLNLTFPRAGARPQAGAGSWPDAQAIMAAAPELCVSTGSACSSAAIEPSYVLAAMGLPPEQARASLRVGIGRFTSPRDVEVAAEALAAGWRRALGA